MSAFAINNVILVRFRYLTTLDAFYQAAQYVATLVIFVCAMCPSSVKAQDGRRAAVTQLLKDEGLEDIKTLVVGDTLFAEFEDRAHRGTFRGAAAAIQIVAEEHPQIQQFEMVLTDYKMPQLIVHASRRGGLWDVRVDRVMHKALHELRNVDAEVSSTGKIDITVFPLVSLVNNKLDHLFDYAVRIAPAFATTLWEGSRLTLQPIFPIAHRLTDRNDSKRCMQIGNASLSQQLVSTRLWHASAAVGFFFPERVGVQAKVGVHAARNLDFYLDAGLTYKANNAPQNGFGFVRDSRQVNSMLHADYYEPHSKLQIELQGGRFLYGDKGVRADVTRHFGEYAIGLYGILTGGEKNAGFHFAIPFGGKRQKRSAFLRLRLPEYYALEYSMQSYFKYWDMKMGQGFTTQPDQNHAAHYWEPAFVEEYVERMLNGSFK